MDLIKPLAKATARSGCDAALGGFGGLFDLKAAGYRDPVLVMGTDGVGTKLKVSQHHVMYVGIPKSRSLDLSSSSFLYPNCCCITRSSKTALPICKHLKQKEGKGRRYPQHKLPGFALQFKHKICLLRCTGCYICITKSVSSAHSGIPYQSYHACIVLCCMYKVLRVCIHHSFQLCERVLNSWYARANTNT